MLRLAFLGLLFVALLTAGPKPGEVPLYPGVAPGSEDFSGEEKIVERGKNGLVDRAFSNVDKPTLTVHLPEKPSGVGVLLFPGGGYRHLAIDKEGHDVARWLNTKGIAGFVLKYRLPRTEGRTYTRDTALADARQALRLARDNAEQWMLDPAKIGVMGFSAGGHLVVRTALEFDGPETRPDFALPIYPALPDEVAVPFDAPPFFIVHASDDPTLAPVKHSLPLYSALFEAKIPAEMHIYEKGGHGFGMRQTGLPSASWRDRLMDWLESRGILE